MSLFDPVWDSLTPREQARVKRHVQECARCRSDLQTLRQTVAILHAVPAIKPPRNFYIPASEGFRQRVVQRNRVAYGYLQFATAVASVLLVLVVSGDALLRLGAGSPARREMAPNIETTMLTRETDQPETAPVSAPEVLTAAPAPQGLAAAPPPAAEPTAAPLMGQAPLPTAASPAEAVATVVLDTQEITMQVVPTVTFARSAGAPALPTATPSDKAAASPVAEGGQAVLTATLEISPTEVVDTTPTPVPTETPVPPTATPLPTATPVPPTATPLPTATPVPPTPVPPTPTEQPSPQPAPLEAKRQPPPVAPAGSPGFLQRMQPLLPWLEWILGALVAVLLVAMLWLRRKQRVV